MNYPAWKRLQRIKRLATLPWSVLASPALLWPLLLWALGLVRYDGTHGGVLVFSHIGGLRSWWDRLWHGWFGHAVWMAVIVRPDWRDHPRSMRHEIRHAAVQWWYLGPLFLPVYLALLAVYGYRKHPLEVDAERWARR